MSSKNFQPWLDYLLNEGRQGSLMARIVFNLAERLDALEKATARTVKESLTAAPGGPLSEPPSLGDIEVSVLVHEGQREELSDFVRRVYRAGWARAAMAEVRTQRTDYFADASKMVSEASPAPESPPAAPQSLELVPRLARLIGAFPSIARNGDDATPLAIAVLLFLAEHLDQEEWHHFAVEMRGLAMEAMEDLPRRPDNG